MAKIRLTSPTFDASAQTVTHPSFSDVTLAGIQLIINVTDQVIIYNFADTTKGGTLAGDVLTLEYDTTSMADTDELMILVEDGVAYQLPTGAATAANQASILAAVDGLEALLTTIDADTGAILTAVDGLEGLLTTIDADTSLLAGAVSGTEVQVDVVAPLPAGTNNIGDVDVLSLPSIPAGTNNIGDVDILSIAAGDNNIGNVDIVTMPGTGVEDAPETAGGTLLMSGTVRRDTAASSAGTTGDNATLNTDSLGRLWISGAAVEDAAETAGGILLMAGSVRRDTAASSAGTTGDNATINTDSVGALWTRDTASQVDDAAFTVGTGRILPTGFLADETATDSVDEGDAGIARMTLNRRQITAGNMVDDATFTLGTDYANPVAGVAVNMDGTDPLAVSVEGDVGALRSDPNRILLVNQSHPRWFNVSADYASAQTNTVVQAAPGASLSLHITDLVISNGATAGNITLLDGSGGTVKFEIYPAINGGVSLSLRNPIKLTANTALCITSTTVTTHSIFVSGYIAA